MEQIMRERLIAMEKTIDTASDEDIAYQMIRLGYEAGQEGISFDEFWGMLRRVAQELRVPLS